MDIDINKIKESVDKDKERRNSVKDKLENSLKKAFEDETYTVQKLKEEESQLYRLKREYSNLIKEKNELEEKQKKLAENNLELTENEKEILNDLNLKTEEKLGKIEDINYHLDIAKEIEKEINKEYDKREKKLDRILEGTEKVLETVKNIASGIWQFEEPWRKVDQSAVNFAKHIGLSAQAYKEMRRYSIDLVRNQQLAVKYNISPDELIKLQEGIASSIGRNISFTSQQLENVSALRKVVGEEDATTFIEKMQNFGIYTNDAVERVGKMFQGISNKGIVWSKYSKNLLDNIKLAQTYTFKDGLRGLQRMAAEATRVNLNMQQAVNFAEKVNTIEGAITTGAQLQVLGGPFAQFGDPMGMLYESLNEVDKLQDRITNMFGNLAYWDTKKGHMDVSRFDRQRIRVASEAMGLDYNNIIESIMTSGMLNRIQNRLDKNLTAEQKQSIASRTTYENGRYVVQVGERKVNIEDLRANSKEFKNFRHFYQSQSDDIKYIAKSLTSADEAWESLKKQYDTEKAALIETTGIGDTTKAIFLELGQHTQLLKTIMMTVIGYTALKSVGKITNMFGGPSKMSSKAFKIAGKTPRTLSGIGSASKIALKSGGAISAGLLSGIGTAISDWDDVANNRMAEEKYAGRIAGSGLGGWGGAAAGAAIGTAIAPGIGTAIGAMIGGFAGSELGQWGGGGFSSQSRRSRNKQELGLDFLQGDYSVKNLKNIREVLRKGGSWSDLDEQTQKRIKRYGERDLVEQLLNNGRLENQEIGTVNKISIQNATIDSNNLNERKFAKGGLLIGPSHANGGMRIGNTNHTVEGGEFIVNKHSTAKYLDTLKSINSDIAPVKPLEPMGKIYKVNENTQSQNNIPNGGILKIQPLTINLNGTINLRGANGEAIDIGKELLNNPQFKNNIVTMISKELNVLQNGGFVKSDWRQKYN